MVCILYSTHYREYDTLGLIPRTKLTLQFSLDTSVGLKRILSEELPSGLEYEVDTDAALPSRSDVNVNPLSLGESVWLTFRFGKTLFRVLFWGPNCSPCEPTVVVNWRV